MEPPFQSPSLKKTIASSPLYQMVLPKQSRKFPSPFNPETLLHESKLRSRNQPILGQPRKTKPIVWFAAILCMILTLLIIFFGVAIIIIFVAVQPKVPIFDTPAASLTSIYFNYPQLIGGDVTFMANFSNPNRKLNVRFEKLYVELYFAERAIARQEIQPFSQSPGESKLVPLHFLSSLAYAPPNLAVELQKQGQRNRVVYNMKGTFRVRVNLGGIHYSYWVHGECEMELTSPPNGVMIAHTCSRTKR